MRSLAKAITLCCITLLVPLSAAAKRTTPDCAVLVEPAVQLDAPFTVRVRRVPAYPGQWFSPTITVEVVAPLVPTASGWESYSQTLTRTFQGILTANLAEFSFTIPASPDGEYDGEVDIFATVSEPVGKRRTRDSFCEATTLIEP